MTRRAYEYYYLATGVSLDFVESPWEAAFSLLLAPLAQARRTPTMMMEVS
jgi:hypothetical protein